eukprot:TRINITY_DN1571_c0_g1_i2.p1 TRINITY_DN1571_c0_g1~~TRINITY_DN1571_c0_g1_i2.p1  ORF type:complete len:441 (+),score=82.78 TRINITY_DN1571_c0_g1_i2:72-1394(+)
MRTALVFAAFVIGSCLALDKLVLLEADGGVGIAFCPNNCSYPLGTCSPSYGCQCSAGYAGPDCSYTIEPIELNTAKMQIDLISQQWKYYSFDVTDYYSHLIVVMTKTSTFGDPDLFVRFNQPPTQASYDVADFSVAVESSVELKRNQQTVVLRTGTYVMGIFAFGSQNVTFDVTTHAYPCIDNCHAAEGYGSCDDQTHVCHCAEGWTGDDCSSSLTPLSGVSDARVGRLESMEWVYFEMQISSEQAGGTIDWALDVERTDPGVIGYIDLYVKHGSLPTSSDYDLVSARNAVLNMVKQCSTDMMTGVWYVGLYNWGFDSANYTLTSTLKSKCPGSCSGRGQCGDYGLCMCQTGFTGGDCSVALPPSPMDMLSRGAVVGIAFLMLIVGAVTALVLQRWAVPVMAQKYRQWRGGYRGHVQATEGGDAWSNSAALPTSGTYNTL